MTLGEPIAVKAGGALGVVTGITTHDTHPPVDVVCGDESTVRFPCFAPSALAS